MSNGYSHSIVQLVKKADSRLIGVALGRLCIERNIPVRQVAERFGVSRQTVYSWFTGKHIPKSDMLNKMHKFVVSLADK